MIEGLEEMIKLADINSEQVSTQIGDFIVNHLLKSGLQGAVLGLSGGVDSAVVAAITKAAFDRHGGGLTLRAYYLPAAASILEDEEDAMETARQLQLPYEKIDIQPILDLHIARDPSCNNPLRLGNLAAAERMAILSDKASQYKGLVLGTGNRDEYFLGYATKRGDGAADLQPLLSCTKRMVYQLAEYHNLLRRIIQKEPSARLFKGQTDAGELGFTYFDSEPIINGFLMGFTEDEIFRITGLPREVIRNVHERNLTTEHKRKLAPFPDITIDYHNDKLPVAQCDKALVIGRFQMLHIGHVDMFYQIAEQKNIKKIIVGIGTQGNTKDPGFRYLFNFNETKHLVEHILKDIGLEYAIYEIPDINDNLKYAQHVSDLIPELDERTAVVTGDPKTIKCFDYKYPILRPELRITVHSSRIRELILAGKPYAHLVHDTDAMARINYEGRIKAYAASKK